MKKSILLIFLLLFSGFAFAQTRYIAGETPQPDFNRYIQGGTPWDSVRYVTPQGTQQIIQSNPWAKINGISFDEKNNFNLISNFLNFTPVRNGLRMDFNLFDLNFQTIFIDSNVVLTETDPLSIHTDGSSTTTAPIPFAEGLSIGGFKYLLFDNPVSDAHKASLLFLTGDETFYIKGMDSESSGIHGGIINLTSGRGLDSGNGGDLHLFAGTGGDTGNGGNVILSAGSKGASYGGIKGSITIKTGDTGLDGNIFIEALGTGNILFMSPNIYALSASFPSAGFVKNGADGLLSGGNSISEGDIPDLSETYVTLDQTTPQSVDGGVLSFKQSIAGNDDANFNRFCFPDTTCMTTAVTGSGTDTNWQTSWTLFDQNLMTRKTLDLNHTIPMLRFVDTSTNEADFNIYTDSNELAFWDMMGNKKMMSFSGNRGTTFSSFVGIGTPSNTTLQLDVLKTATTQYSGAAMQGIMSIEPTNGLGWSGTGFQGGVQIAGSNPIGNIVGLNGYAGSFGNTSTVDSAIGLNGNIGDDTGTANFKDATAVNGTMFIAGYGNLQLFKATAEIYYDFNNLYGYKAEPFFLDTDGNNIFSFYDGGQTMAKHNWGFYGLSAHNYLAGDLNFSTKTIIRADGNITMTSPNGTIGNCGMGNDKVFRCS